MRSRRPNANGGKYNTPVGVSNTIFHEVDVFTVAFRPPKTLFVQMPI